MAGLRVWVFGLFTLVDLFGIDSYAYFVCLLRWLRRWIALFLFCLPLISCCENTVGLFMGCFCVVFWAGFIPFVG